MLTDEQIADLVFEMNGNEPSAPFWRDLARAIEAAACAARDARIAELERQLAEARAQVAEECAKVCETVGNHNITAACAGAIRARKPA